MSAGRKSSGTVDNSPSALILPTSILDMIEEANDYYFPTITGVYLKVSRTLITIATVFFTPLYLLFMQNLRWLPSIFSFVVVQDQVNIPLIWQFLLLELSIDGLRLAAMNTPTMLSTPLSVIAGIVMGEFSVESAGLIQKLCCIWLLWQWQIIPSLILNWVMH